VELGDSEDGVLVVIFRLFCITLSFCQAMFIFLAFLIFLTCIILLEHLQIVTRPGLANDYADVKRNVSGACRMCENVSRGMWSNSGFVSARIALLRELTDSDSAILTG